jgi:dGTP triphosphohydrolase
MDKLQWFKFTPTDWVMGKIQRCPEVTQARFLRLCCLYWNRDCETTIEDAIIEIEQEHFDILKSKKIITTDETDIYISFLDEQNLTIKESKQDKSKSGIVGNLKRWHNDIYKKFIDKEISLDMAVLMSKSIAKVSHTDSIPIDNQSQNIADKIREDKTREYNINNSLISEIKISDVEESMIDYFKIAKDFQQLFIDNLTEKNASIVNQQKATFKNYVDPIRLMIQNQEASVQDLRDVYAYLADERGEFWKANILSTAKLRKQILTLLMSARETKPVKKPLLK